MYTHIYTSTYMYSVHVVCVCVHACVHLHVHVHACTYTLRLYFSLYSTIHIQIAEFIRGGKAGSVTGQLPNQFTRELSVESWRIRIRQAWLLGFLDHSMSLGKGQDLVGHMVFNAFTITEVGMAFLEDAHSVSLPTVHSGNTYIHTLSH